MMNVTTYSTVDADDEASLVYLAQIVDIDGPDIIRAERPVYGGSRRAIGTEYDVGEETAAFITESVRRFEEQDE